MSVTIQVQDDWSGSINWDGVSDTFEGIAADARNQLGIQGNQPQMTTTIDDVGGQGFFIQGDFLNFDPDYVNS